MKTSLEHLPAQKQEQLQAIVKVLREETPAEMVILFGSHARGDWVEDAETGYRSDYDLLVVVESRAVAEDEPLWSALRRRARALSGETPVSLLAHDLRQVNQEIRVGQYFFADVVNEGVLLHDTGRFHLARPKALSERERLSLGEHNLRYWFESATAFFRGCRYFEAQGQLSHAAFLLHQAAERYYHAASLVFTGYKAKTHDIEDLGERAAAVHPLLAGALPRASAEDDRLFKLLRRAYIEARYSQSYRITVEELDALRARVAELARRVRAASVEKLGSFAGPEAVSADLPEAPSADEEVGAEIPDAPPEPALAGAWKRWLVEHGEARGRLAGLADGEARGRLAGLAEAIVDALRRREIGLTAVEAQRVLDCRDEGQLQLWWDRALTVASSAELFTAA